MSVQHTFLYPWASTWMYTHLRTVHPSEKHATSAGSAPRFFTPLQVGALDDYWISTLVEGAYTSGQPPTSDLSLKVVLNTLPNLVALHVSGFEPQASNAVVDWVGKNPLPNEFALRTLSIGRTQHRLIGRSLYTERACDMFIAMFTDGGCSSRIQHFNMLSFSPLIIPFLENWGPSLKTLTFELPMRYHSEDRHQPKLVEHCNGLEEVTFLARSISRTKTSPALPDKLPTVRLVKLICRAPQPRYDLPRVSTFIQNLLHDLRDGDYPELESVHIELQGDGVPCLESSIWFQALKRIWRTSKRDEAGKTKPMRIDFK
ncbi:hypothetical protein NMY22_g6992 [Coprinellus aureogranulatus]|nr:hypothetical protein NMY22_g6992 [Coprinellus aureogranulatus]